MKKKLVLIGLYLYSLSLFAQSHNDYMDDSAVAGGADRALNGIIIITLLFVGFIVVIIVGNIFFKVYNWFYPEKDPSYKERIRKETIEKANRTNVQEKLKKESSKSSNTNIKSQIVPPENKKKPLFSDRGFEAYVATFEMTVQPEFSVKDLYACKMYDGDKLVSTWHGAGTTYRHYDINPKEGTRIICDCAFDDYNRRFESSIILPNTVVAIGYNAFLHNSLNKFTIPPSVKYITGNPFSYRCKEIICLSDRFSFENGCLLSHELSLMIADLSENSKIKETPKGIKYIGRGAYSLQSPQLMKIDSSVVAIARNAFGGVDLRVLLFYGKVGYIDEIIFGCPNLKKIIIPKDSLGHYKKVIPSEYHNLLTEMGDSVLSDTEIIKNIILDEDADIYPNLLVPLGEKKVVPSKLLEYIEITKKECALSATQDADWEHSVVDWGEHENEEHKDWEFGEAIYTLDGKKFLRFMGDMGDMAEYVIKEGVKVICDEAFYGIRDDRVITFPSTVKVFGNFLYGSFPIDEFFIPKSVQTITGNPFAECAGTIKCDSPNFVFENGVLYDKCKKRLISAMWGKYVGAENRIIDPNVVMIGRYSFYGKSFIDSKPSILPTSVLYIGENAFGHSSLEVVLPKNLIEIGKEAFSWSGVKHIELPSTLTKLGVCAFAYCKDLESLSLSPNLEVIEEGAFRNCEKLTHVYIPEGIKVLKKDCFSWCEKLREVRFPNSLERIEEGAFSLCPISSVVVSRQTIIEAEVFTSQCEILYRD